MGYSVVSRRVRHMSLGACAAFALVLGGVCSASADFPPKVDHSYPMVQPEYPDTAQLAGEMGDVLVDVYVNANGKPRKFRINKSSGYTDLDNSAAEAVAMWHYVPAVKDGDTTSDWVTLKVHFGPEQQAPQPTPASTTAAPTPQH